MAVDGRAPSNVHRDDAASKKVERPLDVVRGSVWRANERTLNEPLTAQFREFEDDGPRVCAQLSTLVP